MRKQLSFYLKKGSLRRRIILLLILVVAFVLANIFLVYYKDSQGSYTSFVKKVTPLPAIIIGNKIITVVSYERELAIERKIQETAYKISFDNSAEGKAFSKKLKEQTKEKMVNNFLMDNMLSNVGLFIDGDDVAKEYDMLVENTGGEAPTRNILKFFAGLTVAETKSRIYQYLLEEKTKDYFLAKVKISSINILVSDVNNQGQWTEAENKARLVENSVKSGSSFELARQSFGATGAVEEEYYVSDLSESIRSGIANVAVNNMSGIIKGENGYYLVKILEKKTGYNGSLGEFLSEKKQGIRIWRLAP